MSAPSWPYNPNLFRRASMVIPTAVSRLRLYHWRCSKCGLHGTHAARDGENNHNITSAVRRDHTTRSGGRCGWDEEAVYIRKTQTTH